MNSDYTQTFTHSEMCYWGVITDSDGIGTKCLISINKTYNGLCSCLILVEWIKEGVLLDYILTDAPDGTGVIIAHAPDTDITIESLPVEVIYIECVKIAVTKQEAQRTYIPKVIVNGKVIYGERSATINELNRGE